MSRDKFRPMPWNLYIIQCSDKYKSLYTGITTDISRRLKEHNSKKGAFFTQNKTPVKLVHLEAVENRSEALRREHAIKRLTRKEKLELVKIENAAVFKHGSGSHAYKRD